MDSEDERNEEDRGEPRVFCQDCRFQWFGATAAHGLSVIGHCPRCGGVLHFREHSASESVGDDGRSQDDPNLEPWQVLGRPHSWSK
jgi:hypothetical protein